MKRFILAVSMAFAFVFAFAPSAPLRAAEGSKIAETKAEYVKKARAELDELSIKIDALELKAKEAGASTKAGMDQKLKALKARRKTAKKDFAKLKRASGNAWTDLKAGVDKGIEELKTAYDEAAKD
jgi:hypothetical protein